MKSFKLHRGRKRTGTVNGGFLGKDPELLPTPSLTPDQFEDFTERLLSAHRFCSGSVRHIARVERWGRKGDKQDGIDFEGEWSDGKRAAWQCKRYDKLTAGDIKEAVKKCTYKANEFFLVFSGEASSKARIEIGNHQGWQLLDRRGLGRLLQDLPLHKRREVLDDTWGIATRRLLLAVPGEDAFLSLNEFTSPRQEPDILLNDCGPLIGRREELATLKSFIGISAQAPTVVLVTGHGGQGKTRLVIEALTSLERESPSVPALCLDQGRSIDGDALKELPHTSACLFVDDAHLDPAALRPLLSYVIRTPGTQLILAARESGRDQIKAEVFASGIPVDQISEVSLGELSLAEAKELVSSLSFGAYIAPDEVLDSLAQEAISSPHIAVLASNLAQRGLLAVPIAVNQGLREQVMLRYQRTLAGDIEHFDVVTVQKTLAVFAAIGPVDDTSALHKRTADFSGLDLVAHLRLVEALKGRGLLAKRSGHLRVVPDVLADQILEHESIIGGYSTDFPFKVWNTFAETSGPRIALTLSELDWRLAQLGAPSIDLTAMWAVLADELARASIESLGESLEWIQPLSYTQPKLLVQMLDQVRARFTASGSFTTTGATGDFLIVPDQSGTLRAALGFTEIAAIKVASLLSRLYGQSAINSPGLLELSMDALWALRRWEQRSPELSLDHPERVLADRLANLVELPDPTFPPRIVDRVEKWLHDEPLPSDTETPLFALKPLIAKEGYRVQLIKGEEDGAQELVSVNPEQVESLRDKVRELLVTCASSANLRRAGAAAELLCDMLNPSSARPTGGSNIGSWEGDDKKTWAALTSTVQRASPVVNFLIRQRVARFAETARSASTHLAALELVTLIDQRPNDLVEALIDSYELLTSRRGQEVPTLQQIEESMRTAAQAIPIDDDPEDFGAQLERHDGPMKQRDKERKERRERVVQDIFRDQNSKDVLDDIQRYCLHIQEARPLGGPQGLSALFRTIASKQPQLVPELVKDIVARQAGPLDKILHILLYTWKKADEGSYMAWLVEGLQCRDDVRAAIGKIDQEAWVIT